MGPSRVGAVALLVALVACVGEGSPSRPVVVAVATPTPATSLSASAVPPTPSPPVIAPAPTDSAKPADTPPQVVDAVQPGNQVPLAAAKVPFAQYLNGMHNRIHPLFADGFLVALDALSPTNALNDQRLVTQLEIVLLPDGHIDRMGIVKSSGVAMFDIGALDSVQRAQPFGPVPPALLSPDRRVYLHWEFHRDEVYACTTMNVRPFLLSGAPQPPPTAPTPSPSASAP